MGTCKNDCGCSDESVEKTALYEPTNCKIIEISDLTPSEKLFKIEIPVGMPFKHQPGQFVQVSILGLEEAPISISSAHTREGYFELGVRKMGKLTSRMHEMKVGDMLGIRGPFGTFFNVKKMRGKDMLLIAGGCGLAPMRSLIQYCEDRADEFGKVDVLYGAKSPADVLYKEEIPHWDHLPNMTCSYTVDNIPTGTCFDGHVGLITTLVPPLDIDPENTVAVIVGPPIMYKFVIMELEKKGIPKNNIIVSLERYMRCGVGKCGHCAIDELYCCLDGPVFYLDDIEHIEGAL
ncbi:MAG: FAD/NAD(P)-binding protein [Alphaproteobacteria bacterium]